MYYIVIIIYAGIGTSFSRFWLAVGIIGIGICDGISYMLKHSIVLKSSLQIVVEIAVVIVLVLFIILEGTIILHANTKANAENDYIIILGAQVKGNKISRTLKRRLDTAFRYLDANPNTIAIVSGGQGENETISEAEAMYNYLVGKGISSDRIQKEEHSRNTFENILFSKSLLQPSSSVAIVTNSFHLYRAMGIAKEQGIKNIQGIAAPTDKILAINYYTREVISVLKHVVSR
jgi:Uncharacterized conserved protein